MTSPWESDRAKGDPAGSQRPVSYAAQRPWRLPSSTELPLRALGQAWDRARSTIEAIRHSLQVTELPPCVRSVAVSGSLGRMEYTSHSDVDLIMIAEPASDQTERSEAGRAVWNALAPLQLRQPLAEGVFSAPVDESLLTSADALGAIDEPKAVFGIRMQLLLDTQPVFGDHRYERLIARILDRYQPDDAGDSYWNALLDDLIRYHRSLRTIYRWTRRDEAAAWRSRDIKMTHSRLLIYAGLLFLLGEASSRESSGIHWLARQLRLTPLERLALSTHDDAELQRVSEILQRYDHFLEMLSRTDFPQRIAGVDTATLQANDLYRELRRSGEALSDELYALLLLRLPRWTAEFQKKIVFGC